MKALSAVILTRDEEKLLPGCLASVGWADEVLVLDSYSADRTLEIARASGARIERRRFEDFARQRNAALNLARSEWVLFVDADERVSDELRQEITRLLCAEPRGRACSGFWIPRHNYIFGAWIKHAGWYPDRQLRLLLRTAAHYDLSRPVHELVQLDGEAGLLCGHLIHENYESIAEFVRKQRTYAGYEAQQLMLAGVRPRVHNFVLQPLREFRRRLVNLQGWKDGWRGWLLSGLMAWHTFDVYRQLHSRSHRKNG